VSSSFGSSALATQLRGARNHPVPALIATTAGLVNGATMVLGAAAIGWATDHLVVPALDGGSVTAADWWISAGLILGISMLRWGTIFIRGVATGRVQHLAQADTRRAVVGRYLELSPAWHRRRPPGQLLAHAVSDVDALWSPMQWAYFAAGMVFMLLVALAELFVREAVLGLIALVLVILVFGLNLLYQQVLVPRAREVQAACAEVAARMHESVEGGPVVRSLGLFDEEQARIGPGVARLESADMAIARISSIFDPLLELLPTAAILAVLAASTPRIVSGELTVGDLVGVVYLLLTITIPLNVISRFGSMLPMASAGRERVNDVLGHPDVMRFGSLVLTGNREVGALEVSLAGIGVERGSAVILDQVDLVVPPGSITAVVGAVGAGKTTLLDVAGGLLHPTSGTVRFDGVDVRDLAAGTVPANVAHVSQSPFLFAESVRDNLVLSGHPRELRPYTDDEIWAALAAASADEVVRALPRGIDTVVGERGATLSGGQRQRICLARALLRAPRLLVLDDATSALDPRVERSVLDALRSQVHAGGPSVLIVANRPSVIAVADQVAYLAGGRIVAVGTDAELAATQPGYARIITAYDGAVPQPPPPPSGRSGTSDPSFGNRAREGVPGGHVA
jgi:ATP-binding cassette, subfamily B, bacterial